MRVYLNLVQEPGDTWQTMLACARAGRDAVREVCPEARLITDGRARSR